jgi:MoaA/NifB/PqqE/SkfB family radical SAM enzyme
MKNLNNFSSITIEFLYDLWLKAKIFALQINVSLKKGNDPIFHKKSITIKEYASFLLGETQPSHPLKVFIEVSNLCNIKCVMCNTFSVLNDLKTESIKTIDRGLVDIDILKKQSSFMAHALWVPLMGYGESTMHKQFIPMLDYLGKSGLRINFFTNGTNLTDELVESIVKSKVADVTISFTGVNKSQF